MPIGAAGAKNLEFDQLNQFFTIKNYIFFGGAWSPPCPPSADGSVQFFTINWISFSLGGPGRGSLKGSLSFPFYKKGSKWDKSTPFGGEGVWAPPWPPERAVAPVNGICAGKIFPIDDRPDFLTIRVMVLIQFIGPIKFYGSNHCLCAQKSNRISCRKSNQYEETNILIGI